LLDGLGREFQDFGYNDPANVTPLALLEAATEEPKNADSALAKVN
jgi:hypothetical protein